MLGRKTRWAKISKQPWRRRNKKEIAKRLKFFDDTRRKIDEVEARDRARRGVKSSSGTPD